MSLNNHKMTGRVNFPNNLPSIYKTENLDLVTFESSEAKIKIPKSKENEENKKEDKNTVVRKNMKSESKISLNHAVLKVENFSKKINKLAKFLILKIIFPIIAFTFICNFEIFLQKLINGLCFHQICECSNDLYYAYTILYEFMKIEGVLIIFFYYGTIFITHEFYQKKKFKLFFWEIIIIFIIIVSLACYTYRKTMYLALYRRIILFGLFSICSAYPILIGAIEKDLNRSFFKKLVISMILYALVFFHSYYFKIYGQNFIVNFFQNKLGSKSAALSFYKIFLVAYNILYGKLSYNFLFYYYKALVEEDKQNYMNFIIINLKFVFVDVFSVKTMNILTSDVNELSFLISAIFYFYSIIYLYSGVDFIHKFFQFISSFCKKPTIVSPTTSLKSYQKMRNGIFLQVCYIILARIISFKIFNYFYLITVMEAFEDCTLIEKTPSFHINNLNLVIIGGIHFVLFLFSFLYMGYNKKTLFEIKVTNLNILEDLYLFHAFYQNVDLSIQSYKVLLENT